MRSFIPIITAAAAFLLAITTAHAPAQVPQSFNPDDEKACERAIGPFPDDGSITDRSWGYECSESDINAEKAEIEVLSRVEARKSKAENVAFTALLSGFERYEILQLKLFEKGCGGGVGCGAIATQEEAQTNYEFLNMLKGFKTSGFPSYSAKDLAEADATLNKHYQEALKSSAEDPCPYGAEEKELCVPQIEIRTMERAWIRYRDAWVAFGAIKWPQVPTESLRTYLTLRKIRAGWGVATY
jgi:uncharacterized protein YecT (DUF1311 family)